MCNLRFNRTLLAVPTLVAVLSALPAFAQISVAESVLTYHNNVQRTGVYDREAILSPASLAPNLFTPFVRLAVRKVDGQVAAQPLYVKGVRINGVPKNVLYVVTRNNSIYAFDADNVNQDDPRQGWAWPNPVTLKLTEPGTNRTLLAAPLRDEDQPPCSQTLGPVGITGTPALDPGSQTMYLVARFAHPKFGLGGVDSGYGKAVYHYLVSMDIRTGQELRRVPINPPGFTASAELNRPALLLLNNVIYVAFGAPVCDHSEPAPNPPSHGFVIAYSAGDLRLLASYNTSPSNDNSINNSLAGIWQSGAGLAGDPRTNFVFALTGNNRNADWVQQNQTGLKDPPFDDLYHRSRTALGESILRLRLGSPQFPCSSPTPCITDHFTAGNWFRLDGGYTGPGTGPFPWPDNPVAAHRPQRDQNLFNRCLALYQRLHRGSTASEAEMACHFDGDSDLSSGGPVVLSNGFVLGGGKQGRIYVLDPNDMRHPRQTFQGSFNTWHQGSGASTCSLPDPATEPSPCIVSVDDYDFSQAWGPNIHGAPVVWQRPGSDVGYLYLMAEKDYLRRFQIHNNGHVDDLASKTSPTIPAANTKLAALFPGGLRSPDGMPGGALSLSSNGEQNAIVWVSIAPHGATTSIQPGVLLAFDALSLNLLWNDPDSNISFAKFVPPTIAGGKVFRATYGDAYSDSNCDPNRNANGHNSCGSIVIYGLRTLRVVPRAPARTH